MYLAALDSEKKHLFRDLEIYMSNIDGDFSDKEKEIINLHCVEMHIDNNNFKCEYSLDEIYTRMKENMSVQEKHIIFLELTATILADEIYHEKEREMVEKLSSILCISDAEINEAFTIIRDMKSVYERCAAFVK